jgi:Zn-dependent protease
MLIGGTWRIGRVGGIELRISSTWLIVFALVVYSLAWSVFPDEVPHRGLGVYLPMAVCAALVFFGSIVVHELAHSLVARRVGIGVESITLFLFGGVATITDEARRARDEFLIAIAGPLASIALAAALFGAERGLGAAGAPDEVTTVLFYLWWVNALIAAFNMLPGFPLDGGRVLRAAIWGAGASLATATRIAALAGRVVGLGLAGVGLVEVALGTVEGVWLVLVGGFIAVAASSGERQTALRQHLGRATAEDLMTPNPLGIDPDASLAEAVDGYFDRYPYAAYPVRDLLRPLGLLTRERVAAVNRAAWARTPARAVMLPLEGIVVAPEAGVLDLLPRLRAGARLLVVDHEGDMRGIIAPSDVTAWLRHAGRGAAAGVAA